MSEKYQKVCEIRNTNNHNRNRLYEQTIQQSNSTFIQQNKNKNKTNNIHYYLYW